MAELLIVWLFLLVALVAIAVGPSGRGGALTLAYFLGLSLIHVPGVLPFLGSVDLLSDRETTQLGFELTVEGAGAFVAGAIAARLIAPGMRSWLHSARGGLAASLEQLGWRSILIGALAYLVVIPISTYLPSSTAVVSTFTSLLVIGFWLRLYSSAIANDNRRASRTLALLPLLPATTLISNGFLSFGVSWVLSVLAFLYVVSRRRLWIYLVTPIVIFLALSLFVTYMGGRDALREVMWYRQSSVLDRLQQASHLVTDFQLLDLSSPEHVAAIDARLNQNYLVGAAIQYHQAGRYEFAYGGTIPYWALIPRAIWPDKPEVGGGGTAVTDYTGIEFAEGTSVGTGPLFEFYVNFGTAGVLIGLAGFGFLLMQLDHRIMRALARGDGRRLLLNGMPGITLLQPGGNFLEIMVGVVGALVAARVLLQFRVFHLTPASHAAARLAAPFGAAKGAPRLRSP
ncbi:hypothetical protein MTX26_35860 (plasmid) [Bradyrhizobium sp. ISRA443]|uniref:hypothetical protein n=1 Tax=unclassified Bradyrhizobium TaxID=2631580 RepID=UPI002479BC0D|nr:MULTISPECIES: hypothetical protein [unclassified Bradyrhizobium]WGR90800.1 hypothetical protein MTX20_00260 [Bradyrhizobium sp. ISRA435]WGS03069.1 hypothetical protein MTX23_36195 [Bradyrhizobium sp. ISRA436]WGS09897.1 hypothetical protein MTX18_35855 [Bradyrhizobium sp. ISRA437]WGS16782.1 hypothetical protein MTX26_35860 [Bradyrhizobium sp. ISRA443]